MTKANLANRLITELAHYGQPIQVVDIGAYQIGQPEAYFPLFPLADYQLLTVTAFDPQPSVCDFINQSWAPMAKAYPYAISDGNRHTLYITAHPLCCSLYPPNDEFFDLFDSERQHFELKQQVEVETYTLNELTEIEGIDFIKLDVQGAELDILRHATKWFDQILAIHCEVEFLELYKNQPLFEDIVLFLRQHGFQFHRFDSLFKKNFSLYDQAYIQPSDQYYYGDAVFVKNWHSFKNCSPLQLLKLAIIFHICYSSTSLAALALKSYQEKVPSSDLYSFYLQVTLPPAPPAGR